MSQASLQKSPEQTKGIQTALFGLAVLVDGGSSSNIGTMTVLLLPDACSSVLCGVYSPEAKAASAQKQGDAQAYGHN